MRESRTTFECRICQIANKSEGLADFDATIFEGTRYFAIASLGGFIPGWTLVCSKAHENNLSAHYDSDEFQSVVTTLVDAVSAEYGSPVIFEHGPTHQASTTGCGTSHAHLHIVPFEGSLEERAKQESCGLVWQEITLQTLTSAVRDREYLFVADRYAGSSTRGCAATLAEPRSQFFRRVLAEAVSKQQLADYRTSPLVESATATVAKLRSRLGQLARRAA